tara:strand:- start:724 stop:957 length:234 start_codon:yes stop_codon:yes gene_type:complete
MPQIGWFEILIIVSIAIIVVGPKDFPIMLKKIGSWIGSAKRYMRDVQNQVTDIANETVDTDLQNKNEIKDKKDLDDK